MLLIFITQIPKAGKVVSSMWNDGENLRWLRTTKTRLSAMLQQIKLACLPSCMCWHRLSASVRDDVAEHFPRKDSGVQTKNMFGWELSPGTHSVLWETLNWCLEIKPFWIIRKFQLSLGLYYLVKWQIKICIFACIIYFPLWAAEASLILCKL